MIARTIRITGTVQGVGFRPFVYRLAQTHGIKGWVFNGDDGVEIHAEAEPEAMDSFVQDLSNPPAAAQLEDMLIHDARLEGLEHFSIQQSRHQQRPTVQISPDLAVCEACLEEMQDQSQRRYRYAYINCTHCGPRYSIIQGLPYDRPLTTMKAWSLCSDCEREYQNPLDRRFHAQPVACPRCGPAYRWQTDTEQSQGKEAIGRAAAWLREGKIIAIKGLGGYHVACDARQAESVRALRERKFRKEKAFALMVKDLDWAKALALVDETAEALLTSTARPITLLEAKMQLDHVAPDNHDLGIMLPYTPLHYLLFAAAAPEVLVMSSANHSSEPIAYRDEDALIQLADIADGFLIGERPIARRVDDSVVRATAYGKTVLRRARGYAPASVCQLPSTEPILALGADLKNSITLVIEGQTMVSQHLGDMAHYETFKAFQETISDLTRMYELDLQRCTVVHDLHPHYQTHQFALELEASRHLAVQHHQAHIASVLAEAGSSERKVLGIALDGTGYGSDGTIWGGEFFVGSLAEGFERVAHLRTAQLIGGDAAARLPVQAAAGFLPDLDVDLTDAPFTFPKRYSQALQLRSQGLHVFTSTSAGRLFDTAAALLGFTREISFEGQAAIWLEHLARQGELQQRYPVLFDGQQLDYQPMLAAIIDDRVAGLPLASIARSFIESLATGLVEASLRLAQQHTLSTVVLSGGVFQNQLLLGAVVRGLEAAALEVLINHKVPANDGGISLGQAAIAAHLLAAP